ncbi:hypothetical protein CBR_g6387 [Chara braunii]|uniref:Uncharacterized protein n=1 Tax=Chara braunii TaxID=69332 RepID=A0A388KJU1_CHABU|nr:hypothetical protein CBR_g6387 [Chara braunii]|eukprot:GBG70258.1 hypothetical protein CBR_g6387 [Chara braunii]
MEAQVLACLLLLLTLIGVRMPRHVYGEDNLSNRGVAEAARPSARPDVRSPSSSPVSATNQVSGTGMSHPYVEKDFLVFGAVVFDHARGVEGRRQLGRWWRDHAQRCEFDVVVEIDGKASTLSCLVPGYTLRIRERMLADKFNSRDGAVVGSVSVHTNDRRRRVLGKRNDQEGEREEDDADGHADAKHRNHGGPIGARKEILEVRVQHGLEHEETQSSVLWKRSFWIDRHMRTLCVNVDAYAIWRNYELFSEEKQEEEEEEEEDGVVASGSHRQLERHKGGMTVRRRRTAAGLAGSRRSSSSEMRAETSTVLVPSAYLIRAERSSLELGHLIMSARTREAVMAAAAALKDTCPWLETWDRMGQRQPSTESDYFEAAHPTASCGRDEGWESHHDFDHNGHPLTAAEGQRSFSSCVFRFDRRAPYCQHHSGAAATSPAISRATTQEQGARNGTVVSFCPQQRWRYSEKWSEHDGGGGGGVESQDKYLISQFAGRRCTYYSSDCPLPTSMTASQFLESDTECGAEDRSARLSECGQHHPRINAAAVGSVDDDRACTASEGRKGRGLFMAEEGEDMPLTSSRVDDDVNDRSGHGVMAPVVIGVASELAAIATTIACLLLAVRFRRWVVVALKALLSELLLMRSGSGSAPASSSPTAIAVAEPSESDDCWMAKPPHALDFQWTLHSSLRTMEARQSNSAWVGAHHERSGKSAAGTDLSPADPDSPHAEPAAAAAAAATARPWTLRTVAPSLEAVGTTSDSFGYLKHRSGGSSKYPRGGANETVLASGESSASQFWDQVERLCFRSSSFDQPLIGNYNCDALRISGSSNESSDRSQPPTAMMCRWNRDKAGRLQREEIFRVD